jgi:hypothetical protein
MIGYRFTKYIPSAQRTNSAFENLLKIFLDLLLITSGNVSEALDWMNDIDRQYKITNDDYGMGDFIEDLKKQGYIKEDENGIRLIPTSKKSENR